MTTPILNLMITSVKKAAHSVTRDFTEIEYLLKNPLSAKNFAIKTQENCQNKIFQDLKRFKPNYSYVLENNESIANKDDSNCFHIQGIVGLDNLSRGIPNFAIALYLKRDNKVFASVLYNPITLELFSAEQDSGAFYNRQKLKYNVDSQKNKKLLVTNVEGLQKAKLFDENIVINNNINTDLCYIASQKIDSGIFYNINKNDIAGALLIIKEANYPIQELVAVNENNVSLLINWTK